jgi:hypothetical protein
MVTDRVDMPIGNQRLCRIQDFEGRIAERAEIIAINRIRPRWVHAALVALAVISLTPCSFAAIGALLSGETPSGLELLAALLLPFMIAVANWPFLALYFVTLKKARRERPSINSVRTAMWSSLAAMVLPNLVLQHFPPNLNRGE